MLRVPRAPGGGGGDGEQMESIKPGRCWVSMDGVLERVFLHLDSFPSASQFLHYLGGVYTS